MKTRDQKQQQTRKQKPAQQSSKAQGSSLEPSQGEVRMLPLNQLHPSPLNVRKVGGQKIEDLAKSIEAEGLIHNLTVIEAGTAKKPRFEVIAGGRRLKALQLLVKQKAITTAHPIGCRIVLAEQATSVSLAENIIREAMHPADQFQAFAQLVEDGKSQKEIGARFGVGASVVRERLAMARVAPEVLKAYRSEAITLDHVMAFTVSSDHDAQRAILAQRHVPGAWEIRRLLTNEAVKGSDRRARFVGEKAYKAAGGEVRKDLFASGDPDGTYYVDGALLERLVLEKLASEAEGLREVWAWVECRTEFDYQERSAYGSIPTVRIDPTPEQAARIEQLQADNEAASEALQAFEEADDGEDGEDEGEDDRWQALSEAEEAADEALDAAWVELDRPDPAVAALAGAVVCLGHGGQVEVRTGLVKPEDKAKAKAAAQERVSGSSVATDGVDTGPTGPADPMPLRIALSSLRTLAVQDALASNPDAALRVLAFNLLDSHCADYAFNAEGVGLRIRAEDNADGMAGLASEAVPGSPLIERNEARAALWAEVLPKDHDGLWQWCMEADAAEVTRALAFIVARSVDGAQRFPNSRDELGRLAGLLQVDMREHWTPNAGYFARLKKADTLTALTDAGKAEDGLTKLKRAQLAEEAAKRLTGTDWLPPTLRAA